MRNSISKCWRSPVPADDRRDALSVQTEAFVLNRLVDAGDPEQLAAPARELAVVRAPGLHSIAALVLGFIAGSVGDPEDVGVVLVVAGDGDHTHAGANGELVALPGELQLRGGLSQRLADGDGLVERAVGQQDGELVATQPSQGVGPAHAVVEKRAQLTQQRVTGDVATRVVDDLELVEIET